MKRNKIWLIVTLLVIVLCMGLVATGKASNQENMSSIGNWTCWDDGTIDPCHNFSLNSVSMTSKQNGWAVGQNGSILHWDGNHWSITQSPTTLNLNAVQFLSANDGWAAGDDGTILHWDSSS